MLFFDFQKEYFLDNEVVQLRPMEASDFEHLVHFALEQPEIWKYSQLPADSLENMKTYIALAIEERKNQRAYPFIVFDKRMGKYAGSTRFYDFQPKHLTVQLGYIWYAKEFQGTGLNKNVKLLMLQFAFETLALERVEFRADANNARSIAAMKSIGCTVEGILRSNCAAPYGRRDSIVLSILKDEWFNGVKEALKKKIEKEKRLFNH